MAKRAAEVSEKENGTLKDGDRPVDVEGNGEALEYEDEFEDEYESEDEIHEASPDSRPNEEREEVESRGMWTTPEPLCELKISCNQCSMLTSRRCDGPGPANLHSWSR